MVKTVNCQTLPFPGFYQINGLLAYYELNKDHSEAIGITFLDKLL